MSKIVQVGDAEYLEPADYNRMGEYPRAALDDVVGDAIGYPAHWAGFTVSTKSAQEVEISAGRYFEGRIVWASDAPIVLNLITYFPMAASDEKWLALVLRGEDRQIHEARAFETATDPETSEPVSISTPVVLHRDLRVAVQQGSPVPPPASQPVIAETDACIAFVRVTTTGIQEIVPGAGWRVKSLAEVEGRVTALELLVERLFQDTETIRTDLGNLGADVAAMRASIPDPRLFGQIVRDTARLSQYANMPEEARNYWFNQGLLRDEWDFSQGGLFRIDDGVRFPYAHQRDHILTLINPANVAISLWDQRLLMPAYDEVVRIESPTGNQRQDIANTIHTVTTAIQNTVKHERIRYGETVTVCENRAGWGALGDVKAGETFKASGETWVSKGLTANPWNSQPASQGGHQEYSAQRVIRETYTSSYVSYSVQYFGISGAIHAQSFLCAQVMVATSVELNFTGVGATGDVHLALCEVNASGSPDFEAVLTRGTLPHAQIKKGWTKIAFEPCLLDQGRRYAWFVTTTGNHQLMCNGGTAQSNNLFAGGTKFICSDGVWSQGDVKMDFTFRLNGAKFRQSRTVVEFDSLSLENGMTEIDMIYQSWSPALTSITWEVRPYGAGDYIPMDARIDNPLANLPPLVQLRAVFIGTEDVAPAMLLTPYSRAITGRMGPLMRGISDVIPFGFTTAQAQLVVNMDYIDLNRHTVAPKLVLASGTVVEPVAVTRTPDPGKPTRQQYVANFTLPAGTPGARVRIDAETDSVIHIPFVQDVQLNAF